MKNFLGLLLGENPAERYDSKKFSAPPGPRQPQQPPPPLPGDALAASARARTSLPAPLLQTLVEDEAAEAYRPSSSWPPPPPPTPTVGASASKAEPLPAGGGSRLLYGSSDGAGGGGGNPPPNPRPQGGPAPPGCGPVSQPGTMWPVRQDLKSHTLPLTARVQIAATNAPIGCDGTSAAYEAETFMNPIETSPPVVATGSLINTYTGEVTDLFEDAMPPPNNGRDPGDAERERRQAQRRLMAAEGNVTSTHRKREQQSPVQPGDAGSATQLASSQISADVATEWNERACRDLFFNRKELAPTEMEMTRNPFGFEGYNNRLRINPYLLPTQVLDDKDWTSNATLLPGGDHRPRTAKTKLRKERPRTDYAGQVTGAHQGATDGKADVRRSQAARDQEGLVEASRGVGAQALYGDAPVVSSGQVRLSARDQGGLAEPPRGVKAQTLDGDAPVVSSGQVRLSAHDRSAKAPPHGTTSAAAHGPGAVVSSGQVRLSAGDRSAKAPPLGTTSSAIHGPSAVTAASVMTSLGARGERDSGDVFLSGANGGDIGGGLAGGAQQGAPVGRRGGDAGSAAATRGFEGGPALSGAAAGNASQQQGARRADPGLRTAALPQRAMDGGLEHAGTSGTTEQRSSARIDARGVPGHRGAEPDAFGGGLSATHQQTPGRSDARTVDPSSLFSTLRSDYEAAGMGAAQGQSLGHGDALDLGDEGPRAASSSAFGAARANVAEASATSRRDLREADPRAGDSGSLAARADVSSLSVRREELQGAGDPRDFHGPSGAVAHGALGEMHLREGRDLHLQERSSGPTYDGGVAERRSRVTASNARGQVLSRRSDDFKVGGDTDFQKKAPLGAREWKNELVNKPAARRSAAEEGQRTLLAGAREPRGARAAKSPFRGYGVRERGGLLATLQEPIESRYDDEE